MRLIILILTFFTATILYAQKSGEKSINFRYVCGAGAMTSESISECQGLIVSKSFVLLRRKLFSDNLEDAILATIALKELVKQKSLTLSTEEQEQISRIEELDDSFSLCYTCTQRYEGTVKRMFKRRFDAAYSLIKFAIFKTE